jgi:flavin-dependent dehydrogenase
VAARRAAPDLRVVLVDSARFPRDKVCGGAITGGGLLEMERAGLALRVPHAVARFVTVRVDGASVRVELPRPAAVVRRLEWDADLLAQAREAGAVVIEGAPLLGLRGDVAETGAGPIGFAALVCADGAAGPSRRLLGLPPGRRAPLREALSAERGQEDLVFDLDALVPGYAWRFPCLAGARAVENAGVYSPGGASDLGEALARWAEGEGLRTGPPEAWSLRLRERGGPVGAGRALLAGEALGADALTGEGIRYALWSGRIAASLAARAIRRQGTPWAEGRLRLAYRARLAASRSGVVLSLFRSLALRLHGGEPRWRRLAGDRDVIGALAELVSGAAPPRPLMALLLRYRRSRAALP